MLIRQQRSDKSLYRILSAHTTMKYRVIELSKEIIIKFYRFEDFVFKFDLKLIFHGEYLRAIRNKTIKTIFEINLVLKSIRQQSDSDQSFQF
jgi:hypothetical protein